MTKLTNPIQRSETRLAPVFYLLGVIIVVAFKAPFACLADEGTGEGKLTTPLKKDEPKPPGPEVKDERPPGGDGSMFFKVFVSRSDRNGDGVIEKSEFRGGSDRFDQMDKNENGKLDRDEIDELHRRRMADPLSMRQRIARGETRRPPIEPSAETTVPSKTKPAERSVLTPLGTRITAREAFTRLDVNKDGKVNSTEFQRSPGMGDAKKAQEVVAKVDQDDDGVLSFSEFNTVFAKRRLRKPVNKPAN